nr:hypothetical protein Iba_chr03aCG6340 [Ipomoea batatas]GMD31132.1 hypothetical protein Iba_chr09aCG13660 [Ipomoea batatas]
MLFSYAPPKRHRLAGWMGFSSAIWLPWQRISYNEEIIEAPSLASVTQALSRCLAEEVSDAAHKNPVCLFYDWNPLVCILLKKEK